MISYLPMGKKVVILMVFITLGAAAVTGLPSPKEWGLNVTGVKTRLATDKKVVALTLDDCGGIHGSGYDRRLIDFLVRNRIPATLFVTGKWIDKNPATFRQLAANPLFEIENHGLDHLPCSVTGRSAYGIRGTKNASEVMREIDLNGKKIEKIAGRRPVFYRSGTAHYDEIAVGIANRLGYQVVNYSINGDLGATASRSKIAHNLLKADAGSIVIMHMNHPERETAEGFIAAWPLLKKRGFTFVKLADYPLK